MINAPDKHSHAEDIVIARIVKPRGIHGEVACVAETDDLGSFSSPKQVSVWMPDGTWRTLKIETHWFHNDRVILKFEGHDTMTAAQTLVGGRLMIPEADQRTLAEGEFFEHQVIGAEAITSEGRNLGHVIKLLRTGGTDVLVIEGDDGRERLVPFADDICSEVDVRAKRITINPPDGLLEL